MRGRAYGVGVGPGDPELMTLKAVRIINECSVIAFPGKSAGDSLAFCIARDAVPGISDKQLMAVYMPMTRDRAELKAAHIKAAKSIEAQLEKGLDVAFLTLGDPAVYSTFSYIMSYLRDDGYEAETVSGVTSFCAAASRLGIALAEWDEALHIIPSVHSGSRATEEDGTLVFMKSGASAGRLRDELARKGKTVWAAERCGLQGERLFKGAENIPDDPGYFTIVIAKDGKQ